MKTALDNKEIRNFLRSCNFERITEYYYELRSLDKFFERYKEEIEAYVNNKTGNKPHPNYRNISEGRYAFGFHSYFNGCAKPSIENINHTPTFMLVFNKEVEGWEDAERFHTERATDEDDYDGN